MPPSVKAEFLRNPVATICAVLAALVSVGCLVTVVWKVPQWTTLIETRMAFNEKADEAHHNDNVVHMPDSIKRDIFVTRAEWIQRTASMDAQLGDIKESSRRQEAKIDKIFDKITE